jgi:hypothetical protein
MAPKKTPLAAHTPDSIAKLADTGTREALDELMQFINQTPDTDKITYTTEHFARCAQLYYAPKTEEEEQQWIIAKLKHIHQKILIDLMIEQDEIQTEIEELVVENQITNAVYKTQPKKVKVWKSFATEDILKDLQKDHQMILDEIEYESAWVAQATSHITVERYKEIPPEHLEILVPDVMDEECDCEECMADKDDIVYEL